MNLPRIKDGVYVINLDNKDNKEMHCLSLFIDKNRVSYFNSFGIEYISPEVLNKIKDKPNTQNIFKIQGNESILCEFYCIAFRGYMMAAKTLLEYTKLSSPNDSKKELKK